MHGGAAWEKTMRYLSEKFNYLLIEDVITG